MRIQPRSRRPLTISTASLIAGLLCATATSQMAAQRSPDVAARPAAPSRVTIPYLANASSPKDLDYAAAECALDDDQLTMKCRFRQVFLTPVSFDASTCAITSNGYERTFTRVNTTATRWTSDDAPQGACGVIETHTLDDGGGTRWTMTIAARATKNGANNACQAETSEAVIYDWRTMTRALPCSNVQPGMIER